MSWKFWGWILCFSIVVYVLWWIGHNELSKPENSTPAIVVQSGQNPPPQLAKTVQPQPTEEAPPKVVLVNGSSQSTRPLRKEVDGATTDNPLIIPADGSIVTIDVNQNLTIDERRTSKYDFIAALCEPVVPLNHGLQSHSVIHLSFYNESGRLVRETDYPLRPNDSGYSDPNHDLQSRPDLGIDHFVPNRFCTVEIKSIDHKQHKFTWEMVRERL